MARSAMSTLAAEPWDRETAPAPAIRMAARVEFRLSVETEACDEKRFDTRRVRSESLYRRRANCLSFASTVGLNSTPAIAASCSMLPSAPLDTFFGASLAGV